MKNERYVCESGLLQEGGDALRFEVDWQGEPAAAFALRHDGQVRAYLNRCAHVPVELDWNPGKFRDLSGVYLICATHGALYLPESGRCVAGPCQGKSLVRLSVDERAGGVWVGVDES